MSLSVVFYQATLYSSMKANDVNHCDLMFTRKMTGC